MLPFLLVMHTFSRIARSVAAGGSSKHEREQTHARTNTNSANTDTNAQTDTGTNTTTNINTTAGTHANTNRTQAHTLPLTRNNQ